MSDILISISFSADKSYKYSNLLFKKSCDSRLLDAVI